jgi:hypothetical protein
MCFRSPLALRVRILLGVFVAAIAFSICSRAQQVSGTASGEISRTIGTLKSLQADVITVSADSGADVVVKLSPNTRILRIPPGEKDLKDAVPLQTSDLQSGDRVLVRGQTSADGSIAALAVIVMKQADLSVKQAEDRDDWQKQGAGGLVSGVDKTAGDITISSGGLAGQRNVVIHTSKDTILRRYAAGSIKYEDARPASIEEIKPGDQLRARGTRNAEGNELSAKEVVSGTFRNIAGTIGEIDPASNSVTVKDAIGKSQVVVKLRADAQVKKLPAEFAQRIAMRLKGPGAKEGGQGSALKADASPGGAVGVQGQKGSPDLQRFLARLPNVALTELHKGDAVMIVSTEGKGSDEVTAITLLAGVEPLLTVAPARSAADLLSQWTLGGSAGEGEGGP